MPRARGRALIGLAAAIAAGEVELDPGADRDRSRAPAAAPDPGIGPWTADYLAMRALGDPDVFLATDLGVRHALAALGRPTANARAVGAVAVLCHAPPVVHAARDRRRGALARRRWPRPSAR